MATEVMSVAMEQRPIDLVLERLGRDGCNPRQASPNQWNARCPHQERHNRGDKNPSLSVSEGPDGKALIHCHTGCTVPDIARALNINLVDLFPVRAPTTVHVSAGRRIKAIYDYYDAEGTLIFQVVRQEPKTFRQRQPDGNGGWTWNLQSIIERPLYQLPQVRAAIEAGKPIWIVEGEKDAENLQWKVDGAVTCNSGGAGSWRAENTRQLEGATTIRIIHDNDGPGLEHAKDVAETLTKAGYTGITVYRPPDPHRDISDALAAGVTRQDLIQVWSSKVPEWATATAIEPAAEDDDWAPVDLVAIARLIRGGQLQPTLPTILLVRDALPLLYRERVNSFFGESGSGKTWVALAAAAHLVRAGERVMFVDYEDNPKGITERLVLLELTDDEIGRFDYRNPTTSIGLGVAALTERAEAGEYGLIIIDSTGEAMAAGGTDSNADNEVAQWFALIKRLLQLPGAPAVLVLDHVPKATDAPTSYAIGSQRKRAAVTGASYRIDTVREPAKGKDGLLKLTVAKDRLGNRARGTIAAIVDVRTLDNLIELELHISDAQLAAAAGERFRPTIYMERISKWLEINPRTSKRQILIEVEGKRNVLEAALEVLVEEGRFSIASGPRNAILYTVVTPYRESDDLVLDVDNSQPRTAAHRGPTAALAAVNDPRTAAPPLQGAAVGDTLEPEQLPLDRGPVENPSIDFRPW